MPIRRSYNTARRSRKLLLHITVCIAALFAVGHLPAFGQNAGYITAFDPANVLQQRNQMAYELFVGDKLRGPIIVFSHLSGVFVPAETLLARLGYAYHYDADDQLLQIDFKDKTSLTIRFRKREYIRDGDTNELDDNDFILKGYNVYLSARFLNKTFPSGFSVDQAARKLRVISAETEAESRPREPEKKEEVKKEKEAEKKEEEPPAVLAPEPEKEELAPPPLAAPSAPVIIDDVHLRKNLLDSVTGEPFAEDVLRFSYGVLIKAARPVYPPSQPSSEIRTAAAPPPAPSAPKSVESEKQEKTEPPKAEESVHIVDGEMPKPPPKETKPTETPPQKPAAPEAKPAEAPSQPAAPEAKTAEAPPQPATAEKPAESKPAQPDEGEEKNILVLQPKIKRNPPSDLFLEAFEIGEIAYLPLSDIAKLLEFDIKADDEKGTAEGSFISPGRTFSLNLDAQEVRANGQTFPLEKGSVLRHDNKLFVRASDFKTWFDVSCSIDKKMMYLNIDTLSPLPMEARMERHKLWDKLMARQKAASNDYKTVEAPYELADWPFVDVTTSHTYSHAPARGERGARNAYTGDYSLLGSGDLGYLTTNVYATGSNGDPLSNLRLTSGRKDPGAALLGPLRATAFSLGDIDSPALSYVTSNTIGRGASVTNKAINAPSSFDTHTFSGNATPGWEVELYRNNLLIGFQTADANGRYEFKDVPLIYGNNTFRTVLYGSQGQQEEKVENFSVGASMLQPGSFEYSFSVNEEGKTLAGVGDSLSPDGQMPHGLRGVAEVRYGLADYLSIGTGLAQAGLRDGDHRYMSALADTSLAGVITEANFVKDMNGGWLAGLTALTSIDDISMRARHTHYRNFVSGAENDFDIPRKAISSFDMNSQFYAPLIEDFNFGTEVKRETFETQVPRMTYGATFSKAFWGMSFSNTMNYVVDAQKRFRGILGWQTKLWNILFRLDGNYEIKPEPGLNSTSLIAQYWLDRDLSAQTRINQQLGTEREAGVTHTFNWDLKNYRLSFSGEVTEKMEAMAGVSLVFSLGRDKLFNRWHTQSSGLADSGAISGRVFADDNYNGVYDDGEKIYPEATMRVNALSRQPMEDNSFLAPIDAYDPVDVDLDVNSLKDPMLSPAVSGYRVITRPGNVASLDFPIISTSEVDGNVTLLDGKDDKFEIPDIVVQLNNKEGYLFKSAVAEADGYFLFSKVPPGDYTIAVPPEALTHYNAEQREPVAIRVEKASDFLTGKNVVLHLKGDPPANLKKIK